MPIFIIHVLNCLFRMGAGDIQTVNVVSGIVGTVLRPPEHRDASEPNGVDNTLIVAEVPHARVILFTLIAAPNPWGAPREMIRSTRGLLRFVCPVHGCGTHIPAHGHQLVHHDPHGIFILDDFAQLGFCGDPMAGQATADPAHDVTLHCVALSLRLLQE